MLKKVWAFIQTYALTLVEKPLLEEGGQAFEKMLEDFRLKHQEIADGGVVFLYMLVTTSGADIVARTDNEYDDHALEEVKAELVEYATKHGIKLPEINKV